MPGARATPTDPTGTKPGRTIRVVPNPLDPKTVAAVAYQAGFRGNAWAIAVAVSFAENGAHDATAQHVNADGSVDTGLWQINSVHDQWTIRALFDAQTNANAAYQISSQGRDWQPWVTYSRKLYLAQMPAAHATIADLQAHGGAVTWLQNNPLGTAPGVKGSVNSPNILTQASRGWVGDFIGAVGGYVGRAFKMVGGLILMLMGLYFIARDLGVAPSVSLPIPGR